MTKRFRLDRGRARSFKDAFVGLRRKPGVAAETLLALDDLSFALEQGETLGLIGPNGTGKSTVLKLAARIIEPTAGRVLVRGPVAALLELGAGFHPDLSGRENIYLNGSMMGFGQADMDRRLARIVDFSELGRFIDMPVKHYSSGMYMRLGFATAIHLDAEILLIDEVLAVGDQAFQTKCRDRIAELRKAGVSIVLVSHDNQAIRELCSHALWIEDGRLRRYGATPEVVDAFYASMVAREEARLAAEGAEPAEPPGEKERWGSGEVRLTAVEILAADGDPHAILASGAPAVFRLHYQADRRVERVVFGIGIHRQDGLHVSGPNTREAGLSIEAVEGEGRVDFRIEALPLLPGSYELSASCYDQSCRHAYDHHHRRFPFRVRMEGAVEPLGLVALPARWEHRPGAGAGGSGPGSPARAD